MTIAERVRRSRAAQGLPPTVTDPAALERVAVLLTTKKGAGPVKTDALEVTSGSSTTPTS